MATDTAAAPRPTSARTRPDPTRRLWQVPVFLVGLAAFAAAYLDRLPLGPKNPADGFRRDVAVLRAEAEKLTPDPGTIKAHLARVASAADAFPDDSSASHFALGTGYVRLAELTADPFEARAHWVLARQHFEAVRPEQLPDPADAPRLSYRLAKARAADLPPTARPADIELIRKLLLTTPAGEDPGDGHRLAAELSLRLVPPDLKQAKAGFTAYIAEAGLATPPASIARAKLRLSEVHLKLGDHAQAKDWFGQIGRDAPADVLAAAKMQLAQIRMAEHDWAGAAREWEQLRVIPQLAPAMKAGASYQLAVCKQSVKPPDTGTATTLYEEVAKADGPEAAAASLRLAELRLQAGDPARHKEAVALLTAAVRGVTGSAEYANPLVPLNEAQAVFELAVQTLVTDGAFDSAAAVADTYKVVAAAGRDRERKAEVLAAWGAAVQKGGGDPARQFADAAAEYTAIAKVRSADTDKADLLRRAAGLYRQAGDAPAAVAALEQVVKLPNLTDDVSGPAWVDYAEALIATNQPKKAKEALQEAMNSRSAPASTAARYRVARRLIDSRLTGNVDLGIDLMDQIAKAEQVGPGEVDMHERALVEVAHEYIRKGSYAEAETRLEKGLNRYPTGGEAGLGRLLLGVCLLQRADPRAKPPAANPAKNREDALRLFKQVVADVDARKAAGRAVDRDPWLRTQAGLRVLQSYQQMGRPTDVLAEGDRLRWEVAGTADELIVLSLMYHGYKQLKKPEGMLTVHGQMREVFDKLKDKPGAFWAKAGEYSRDYWEKVWFAPDPGPAAPMMK